MNKLYFSIATLLILVVSQQIFSADGGAGLTRVQVQHVIAELKGRAMCATMAGNTPVEWQLFDKRKSGKITLIIKETVRKAAASDIKEFHEVRDYMHGNPTPTVKKFAVYHDGRIQQR